jgi:hypothetical protein
MDQVQGLVDHDRVVVYGSTVDHGRRWLKDSLELALGAALVSGSSLVVGEKEKGAPGVPTMGEGGPKRWWVGARCDVVGGTRRRSFGWQEVWRGAAVLGAPFIGRGCER